MAAETKHSTEKSALMPQEQTEAESSAVLDIEGMTCASCAMRIEKGLKKVPGVKDANVNLATEKATVTYDPTLTNITQMVEKVEAVGYKATPQTEAPAFLSVPLRDDSPAVPAMGLSQTDEQHKRRQAELIRKRNLLLLGMVLTL